jgi:hypothetical protein
MTRSWLYPGARVVCVDDSNTASDLCAGTVYAIRKIGPVGLSSRGRMYGYADKAYPPDTIVVWLVGLYRKNYSTKDGCLLSDDYGFSPDRFRPLTTINTDAAVSQMREIVRRAMETKKVDA